MVPTSIVVLLHESVRLLEIVRVLSHKTHCAAVPWISDSSMFSVGGKDQQLMQHCFMMHGQVILPFPTANIILQTVALVHVMPCLFLTGVFAIILQSGEELQFGGHDIILLIDAN